MKIFTCAELNYEQKLSVLQLWNTEYPKRVRHTDLTKFDNYLNSITDKKHFLLLTEHNKIFGWATLFLREKARWFGLVLTGCLHGRGYGTMLLNELKKEEKQLYGWVIDHDACVKADGTLYRSPVGFYLKNGFKINAGIRLELDDVSAVRIEWKAE